MFKSAVGSLTKENSTKSQSKTKVDKTRRRKNKLVQSRIFCGSCGKDQGYLKLLNKQIGASYSKMIECPNTSCNWAFCSDCAKKAWKKYNWKWTPHCGPYNNPEDDEIDAMFKFTKHIMRCTTCTPKQPIYQRPK